MRIGAFDLSKEENKTLNEALFQIYHVPESKREGIVKFYFGEDYLMGDDYAYENFQKLISKYHGKEAPPPWQKVTREALKSGEQRIVERFKKFSLSAVLIGGFIDGINPCSFATIIPGLLPHFYR